MSPLLANVLLDEVDKELERRGHAFVRYADDCNVYVRSLKAGERVMSFLREKYASLRLRLNESKSAVGPIWGRVPGVSSVPLRRGGEARVSAKSQEAFKRRVREITRRVVGRSLEQVIEELNVYLRGWKGYFRLTRAGEAVWRPGRVDAPPLARAATEALGERFDDLPEAEGSRNAPRHGVVDRSLAWRLVAALAATREAPADQVVRRAGTGAAVDVTSTLRTAGCGAACPVVWQGSAWDRPGRPYADPG
ncbi:MAG: group II intron maturase-specific domain-containing protein [Polyangiales bacterium]